ncbi:MAG: hypothetical protein H6729_12235 [Deltaproteobacteria bacterium]|nr:hypothetical protein [Deltaproteobacteria bacterium]
MKHSFSSAVVVVAIVLGVSLSTLLGATNNAFARCAPAELVVTPSAKTVLPPNPTLYVFAPQKEPPQVRVKDGRGKKLRTTITPLPSPPAYTAFAVRIESSAPSELRVEMHERKRPGTIVRRRYQVRPIDTAQPVSSDIARPSHVMSKDETSDRWTCSYNETANLTVDDWAPAYEVRWRDAQVEHSVVVPPRADAFFERDPASSSTAKLELGHVSCLGQTFEFTKTIDLRIVRLGVDGVASTESSPITVEPPPKAPKDKR